MARRVGRNAAVALGVMLSVLVFFQSGLYQHERGEFQASPHPATTGPGFERAEETHSLENEGEEWEGEERQGVRHRPTRGEEEGERPASEKEEAQAPARAANARQGQRQLDEVLDDLKETLRLRALEVGEEEAAGLPPLPRVGPLPGLEEPLLMCGKIGRHLCFHEVGHTLAQCGHTVPEACLHASPDQGCLHGFIERWLALYGGTGGLAPAAKAERIAAACRELPLSSVGDCLHGAAHFLMAASDNDLAASLAVCKELPLGEAASCVSGAYMLAAPPISSAADLLVSPCLLEDMPLECFRFGAVLGSAAGHKAEEVLAGCLEMEERGFATAFVYSCYATFGDILNFPSMAAARQLPSASVVEVGGLARAGGPRLQAMLFGGHRTIALFMRDKSDASREKFCSSGLRAFDAATPEALSLCFEYLDFPVRCVYCGHIEQMFLPGAGLSAAM